MLHKEEGFTLVELLVGIILIGIVAGLTSSMFSTIHRTQRQTNYTEVATRAAQREMESLRNNNYNSLDAGQTINFTNQLPPVLKNASGIVTVSEPNSELKRVDISVKYSDGSTPREVRLSSLVGILGITQ